LEVQVVDFFSGCGGMSYGFASAQKSKRLGFRIAGAVDVDRHANATYEKMLGIKPIDCDVRELTQRRRLSRAVEEWGLDDKKPLVLIGCAPCQGFSSHRKKDARVDERNGLLEAFATVAVQLRPEVIVMENVPEMLDQRHWRHYEKWRRRILQAGYQVRVQIHNLAEFAVPQERFRALVVAARWRQFAMPKPTNRPDQFVTVREAIGHLPPLKAGEIDDVDPMHETSDHRAETVDLIKLIPLDGGSRRSLPDGAGPECLKKVDGFRDVYGRLAWDKPSVAITARCRTPSCGRFVHPEQHRGLSVREAALLQGFPENYFFEGPFDDKFKQIGNAVSPIFALAIARHLSVEWFRNHDQPTNRCETRGDIVEPLTKSFSSSIAHIKRSREGK
jgi:DNA (cytosine-5)-methyltransferase 1